MADKDKILDEIFSNDPLGLLNVKQKASSGRSAGERLTSSFEEINQFYKATGKAPEPNVSDIAEFQLYARLKSLREDKIKKIALKPIDTNGLLNFEKQLINSIDDIFNDDLLGLFDDGEAQSLFEFKHTPREIARAEADFVARRKPCKKFKEYEALFESVQKDLASGERKLFEFKERNLLAGNFYVHNGVLMYLNKVNFTDDHYNFPSGKRVQKNGRTHCIFENGTESNMLYRSAIRALYESGKIVTENINKTIEIFNENFNGVTSEDKEAGFIYVLSSKSKELKIAEINNLFKIGYSTTAVIKRIKNAQKEPTYLMAPVHLEAEYKTYNMNTQKFEQLLHNFFGSVCLNIDIYDENGRRHMPQEWFTVPLAVIDQAIELIISEKIIEYRYDTELEKIVLKE